MSNWGFKARGLSTITVKYVRVFLRRDIVEIMEARDSHLPRLVELWMGLMEHHRAMNPHHTIRQGACGNWEEYVKRLMSTDTGKVFVAEDGGRAVAYMAASIKEYPPLFRLDEYGFISDAYIVPEYRRHGLGEKLLSEVLAWFRENGIERIELRVEPSNDVGYSFWKKQGFNVHVHTLFLEEY